VELLKGRLEKVPSNAQFLMSMNPRLRNRRVITWGEGQLSREPCRTLAKTWSKRARRVFRSRRNFCLTFARYLSALARHRLRLIEPSRRFVNRHFNSVIWALILISVLALTCLVAEGVLDQKNLAPSVAALALVLAALQFGRTLHNQKVTAARDFLQHFFKEHDPLPRILRTHLLLRCETFGTRS